MIYFIQIGEDGPIKIGFTKSPIAYRISALQTASPYLLTLVGLIDGDEQAEQSLHEKFSEFRMKGEWFEPQSEILEFCRVAKPAAEPQDNAEGLIGVTFRLPQEVLDTIDAEAARLGTSRGWVIRKWLKGVADNNTKAKRKAKA